MTNLPVHPNPILKGFIRTRLISVHKINISTVEEIGKHTAPGNETYTHTQSYYSEVLANHNSVLESLCVCY